METTPQLPADIRDGDVHPMCQDEGSVASLVGGAIVGQVCGWILGGGECKHALCQGIRVEGWKGQENGDFDLYRILRLGEIICAKP